MTTIQYKEIQYDGHCQVEIIDEQLALDLEHFAEVCGQSTDWVLKLIDYEILQFKSIHKVISSSVKMSPEHVVLTVLQRDFDASLSAVAVMLDLIDEVQQLRRQLKHFHLRKGNINI